MDEGAIEAVRERILAKLRRIKERDRPGQIEQGWSYDEDHEVMVPPGWVRTAE